MLRSYQQLHRTDIGFNTSHVLTFHVGAAWDEDRARVGRLQEELVAELQQLPGVLAAGMTSFLPATGATLRYQIQLDGITGPEPGGRLTVGTRTVSAGYLRALQAPLVAGEWCPDLRSDRKAPPTALVNRRLVDLHAAGQDVIGRRFRFDFEQHDGWRIVGVVGNMVEDGPGAQPAPYVYVCAPAGAWPDPEYVVRSAGDPAALMPAIRQVVRRLDPNRPIFVVRLLDDVMADALEQPRLNSALLTGFASAAIALAALGLYGLLTLYVTERRRELGVRLALGAAPADVVRLVVAGAGRLVALGMASGLVLILGTGRMLRTLLFGVTSLDVPALFGAIAVLAIASLAAVWFPARRAARISAIEVIRES